MMKAIVGLLILAMCLTGCSGIDTAPSPGGTVSPGPAELTYDAQYIRTDGYHGEVVYPVVTAIDLENELSAYYEINKDLYDLSRREEVYADTTVGFLDAVDTYDEAYFEDHVLVLVLLEEGSGSIRHEVTSVTRDGDEVRIHIKRKVPDMGTDDMAEWHIFVELERDACAGCSFNAAIE